MRYYTEHFGFHVGDQSVTILCVCLRKFNVPKTRIVFHMYHYCDECGERWYIEKEGDGYRLNRPRTNRQIWSD